MNKITYLNELETALDALPRHLRDQKMYEYERYFYEQELNGVDEGEILKKLKDPQDVAAETKARSVIDYAESKPTFENISRAVAASLSLGILSIFVILIPVSIVGLFVLALFLISLLLLFCPIILLASAISRGIVDSISNVFFAISYSGLGLVFIIVIFKILEYIYRLILKYLLWYIKTVKGSVRKWRNSFYWAFSVCCLFTAATIIWFSYDKNKYGTKQYDKTFKDDAFDNVSINLDNTELRIKQGNQFRVKYDGDNDILINIVDKTLKISDKRSKTRGYAIDMNPFHENKKTLTIEMPDKMIKRLNLSSGAGSVRISDVDLENTSIQSINGEVVIKNSNLDALDSKTNNSSTYISKSNIENSNIKVVIGTLQIDKSQIKQSIFLNDHGDIEFKNMPSKVDAKASTKQGDIRFKYDSKPEDTILKLNPGTGDSVVKNKTFTNGKVGKSDNVLEFYTIDGNIKVE